MVLQPAEKGAKTFAGTVILPVKQIRWHGDGLVATSLDVVSRNHAEALRGARILWPASIFRRPKMVSITGLIYSG